MWHPYPPAPARGNGAARPGLCSRSATESGCAGGSLQLGPPGGDSGRSHAGSRVLPQKGIWVGHLCNYGRPRQTLDALVMNGVFDPEGAVGGVCVCHLFMHYSSV